MMKPNIFSPYLSLIPAETLESTKTEYDHVKDKKGFITKTWRHCKSLGHGSKKASKYEAATNTLRSKSANASSTSATADTKPQLANEGCFPVYVGPDKQKFVVKAKYANHALFNTLLDEAESEYGYNCDGPIMLPCSVAVFCKVLAEMGVQDKVHKGCRGFGRSRSYQALNQSRMVTINQF